MKLVNAEEMKQIDVEASEEYGVPGIVLMDNAAKAVADAALDMLADAEEKVLVLCGKGNNGGDGFGAARWLQSYGISVKCLLVGAEQTQISGDAAIELAMFTKAGGHITCIRSDEDELLAEVAVAKADLIIDAMLGTGFSGELKPMYRKMCQLVNESGKAVLAVDIPTGVNADDGSVCADAVLADETVTMALLKTGLLLYPGKEHAGRIVVAHIGVPEALLEKAPGKKYRVTPEIVEELLPLRKADAHKGDVGRVLVCAGSPGYVGAAALCSYAAVKAGAGLVSLATPLSCRELLAIKLTEVMVHGLLERMPGVLGGGAASDVLQRAEQNDVLAIGPGLGTSDSTMQAVRDILEKAAVPAVIDADALTALVGHTDMLAKMEAPKVLTPHSGEMARLTGLEIAEINSRRIDVALKYAAEWQAVLVLKGAPTIIASPDGTVYVNSSGCSAMATGGSGDVLTGVIAALAAQGVGLLEAALCGVYLHGVAGELASDGLPGLAAGELADFLPAALGEVYAQLDADDEAVYNYAMKVLK